MRTMLFSGTIALAAFAAATGLAGSHAFAAAPGGASFTLFAVHGSIATEPVSINDTGTITGTYLVNNLRHGFVRSADGKITKFDPPGATETEPVAINASGTIVGSYGTSNTSAGFIRTAAGTITSFGVPNAHGFQIAGINANGVIAGTYLDSAGQGHGFLRDTNGSIEAFEAGGQSKPGQVAGTIARALNDAGAMSGYTYGYRPNPFGFGFVRSSEGKVKSFQVTKGGEVWVNGMNQPGDVVGFNISDGYEEAFVLASDGYKVTSFDATACPNKIYPAAINSLGQIAGQCDTPGGTALGFLRSPTGKIKVFRVHGLQTAVAGINATGVIFGSAHNKAGRTLGFVGTP